MRGKAHPTNRMSCRKLSSLLVFVRVATAGAALMVVVAGLAAIPARASEECLACHAPETELTNARGKRITTAMGPLRASVHAGISCVDCHAGASEYPHDAKSAAASCLTCHPGATEHVEASVHASLGRAGASETCIACHGGHTVRKPAAAGSQLCATCHEAAVKEFRASIHGQAGLNGDRDAPGCRDCHGAAHTVLASSHADSPVNKTHLVATCAHCHADPNFMQRHRLAVARPVEAFQASVHGRALQRGNLDAADCHDCHGVHNILPLSDPRSSIAPRNVGATCAECHQQIFEVFKDSVHGEAVARGIRGAPTCVDCHGEHQILGPSDPGSPVYVTNISKLTCARCHNDLRLTSRLDLPADRVASFEDSFHGLASRAGSRTVANCASCHGVHNILPSSDARSTVHKDNLAATCGTCHPDAGKRFAIGTVHVVPTSREDNRILYYVRLFYLFLIPTVVGMMFLHHLLDWWRKAKRHLAHYRLEHTPIRMTLNERAQHLLLLASFTVLVVTGFALKYPEAFWAAPIVRWEEAFPLRGWLHRAAAVMLMAAGAYHVIYLLVSGSGRRWLRGMIPKVRDVRDAVQTVGYNLGYRHQPPTYPKFNYAEKVEYWALVWGSVIMIATGVMLWANNFMLANFPKWMLDVAGAIHFYEAILATLAIVIWHFYAVIFDPEVYPVKWTFVTGRAPEHEVREEEPEPVAAAADGGADESDGNGGPGEAEKDGSSRDPSSSA